MFHIRAAHEDDSQALFRVCVKTGDGGTDASSQFQLDPDALGRRWVGPYLQGPELEFAHALEHLGTNELHGYCLGTLSTAEFNSRLRQTYLLDLQKNPRFVVKDRPPSEWTAEERVYSEYHNLPETPAFVVAKYPSHLHIDLEPVAQGRGLGRQLIASLLRKLREKGSSGVHLEMDSRNERARRFYERLGFREVARVIDVHDGCSGASRREVLSGEGVQFLPSSEKAKAAQVVASGIPHIVFLALGFHPNPGLSSTTWRPSPSYGRGLLSSSMSTLALRSSLSGDLSSGMSCVVFTAPEPWELVKHHFPNCPPEAVHMVKTMDHDVLRHAVARVTAAVASAPSTLVVFGIGGGSACDAAKFAAHTLSSSSAHRKRPRVVDASEVTEGVKASSTSHGTASGDSRGEDDGTATTTNGCRSSSSSVPPATPTLILMPSILSVDAPFTRAAGVRETGKVRYVGDARPDHLLVDFDLLSQAPLMLNRAGVGDVLSIFTALRDWRGAADRQGEAYDAEVALKAAQAFARLVAAAPDIASGSESGLRELAELFVEEVAICEAWGSSRPEEGSEHYLAYCIEDHITTGNALKPQGRHGKESEQRGGFVHGKLVGLCAVAVAHWQETSRVCCSSEALSQALGTPSPSSKPKVGGGGRGDADAHAEDLGNEHHPQRTSFGASDLVAFLGAAQLDCSLTSVGVTREELRAALLHMGTFVHAEGQLLPGVFHFAPVPEDQVDGVVAFVEQNLGS